MMKIKYLLVLFFVVFLCIPETEGQTTYVVSAAGGTHTTIALAYAACTVAGTNYIIEIRTTGGTPYTNAEAKPIAFAANNAASVTIRPEAGSSLTLSTGTAISIFSFTAGDNITIDGRAGGAGSSALTIENTQALASKYAIQFSGGSTFNNIIYCTIKGSNTGTTPASTIPGVIMFGAGTNSNNTIDNCTIQESGAAKPAVGIMSYDATGNNLLTITNNSFVNFTLKGIWASTSQTDWIITGNSFYQTAPFTAAVNMIQIENGGGYVVSGNYFGGQAPNCGGAPYTLNTAVTTVLNAINFVSSTAASTNIVSGNVIQNILVTSTNTTAIALIRGIVLGGASNFTCGSLGNGNVIGSAGGIGSIVLTNNAGATSLGFAGITNSCSGSNSVAYNTIAGITVNGTRTGATTILINNTAGTTTVDNNTFGGAVSNSILLSSNSILNGLSNTSALGITVTNNTFQNMNHAATNVAFKAIQNSAGVFSCMGNTIKNISTAAATTHNMIDHAGSTATISGNVMQDISLTSTSSTAGIFNGINNSSTSAVIINANTIGSSVANNINIACNWYYSNGINSTGTGTLSCTGNIIQNVIMSNTGANPCFQGLSTTAGVLTFTQNTIQNITCNSSGTGNALIGIYVNSTSTGHNLSKNTVTNLIATSAANSAAYVTGIRVSAGSGLIEKNFISALQAGFTSATAEIDGMDLSTGAWDVFNNVVLLQNGSLTNSLIIRGLYFRGTVSRAFHNTVRISGSVAAGTALTAAIDMTASGVKTIENNIFQNLRTGTGTHYSEYIGNTTTLVTNYNYLEVLNNQAQLCFYTVNKTFAQWKAIPLGTKDFNGTISLSDSSGIVTTTPFIGAGTGVNLTATVIDDKLNINRGIACWMGAYEGPDITTSAIAPVSYCQGSTVSVPYTVGGGGPFNVGNTFIAQLSDVTGSFATPTDIGTLVSTTSGTITATIPGGASVGSNYLIHVISSNPIVTGSDNIGFLSISSATPAVVTPNAATAIGCTVFTANWATSANALSYFLDVATDTGFTTFVSGYNNLDVGNVLSKVVTVQDANTIYFYRVRAFNGCGISASSASVNLTTTGAPGTYVVTSLVNGTTVDGVSLRWAITQANANCGHDLIKFNLGAGGPFTIALTAALPNLTDNSGVTIDGWDNSGNNGSPNNIPVFNASVTTPMNAVYKIILGNSGTVATGLVLASNYNVVKGLVLQDFGDGTPSVNDIAITISGNDNLILGCNIGLDATGTTRGTKTAEGIVITGAKNKIGDGTAAGANIISGLNGLFEGILISGAGAVGNDVKGNMLGLQKDGTTIVAGAAQFSGVYIYSSAISNTIGGVNAGEGNVISGQSGANARGVYLNTSSMGGNKVVGNIIGPCADGITNITSNAQVYGIMISSSPDNIIGGNIAGARNIISANLMYGVDITGAGSTGNIVKGNYIGIDKNGTTFITGSTQDYGVGILASSASNFIGGINSGEGNVISGNGKGIYITSTAANGNTIVGNIIGPQFNGNTYLASNIQTYGIEVSGSKNNSIGGSSSGAGNTISANENAGIYIDGAGATANSVKGNFIGIDISGTSIIPGSLQDYGIYLGTSSSNNSIGGNNAGEGNVISGNKGAAATLGFGIVASSTIGDIILGNSIGPQADGITYLASNGQARGIYISNGTGNIIGGNTAGDRNIISANEQYGIYIFGVGSTGNIIKGNYIGIDKNGTTFISGSSQDYGIYLTSSASGNTIGGDETNGEGNVISGNKDGASSGHGIYTNSTNAAGNVVIGNIIGPQADGITYLASNEQFQGIELFSSPNNIIGGNTAGTKNVISANDWVGIRINGAGSTGNIMKGNYIGIDKTGTSFITNSTQDFGIYIQSSAAGNIIGGSAAGEGNVISGNKDASSTGGGIYLGSNAAGGNTILGNLIGTQSDGISFLASNAQNYGVYIFGSPDNIIGGTTAGSRNILSANEGIGVYITGASSTGNNIKGNYIGPNSGLADITGSNQDYGVYIVNSASNNTIGTNLAGGGNIITHNATQGIYVYNLTSIGNKISGNLIYDNLGKSININYGANQGNSGKAIPVITSAKPLLISGTSGIWDNVEVFKSTSGISQNANTYLGNAVADGSGNWSMVVGLTTSDYVLANATDAGNNTSEFTNVTLVVADTITTSAITSTSYCTGSTVGILYTIVGTFFAGNVFSAQLSDPFGSFATPTNIGTLTSTASGTIAATIPAMASGTGYRIRVVSDNPVIIGSDNGSDLSMNPPDGGAGTWTWTGVDSNDWFNCSNWDKKCLPDAFSDVIIPGGTPNNPTITGATADCKTITIVTTNSGHLNIISSASGHLNVAQ